MVLVDEVLYESDRTLVTRRPADGVVLKRLLGPGAPERTRHERAMLERAAGVPGVPALAEAAADDDTLALADPGGGRTLGTALTDGPLPVTDALRLATGLAGTLAGLHRRGLLHRDITPANVLLAPDGTPTLIDFGLATAQVEGPDAGRLIGTLAYVAPEQTGRTGRGVDQRADLYGLGATLYAALTGRAPFGGEDPLRLVHDILVAVPEEPAVLNEDVPIIVSAIVMRLLEKEPDHRYQSAEGLAHDLERVARRRLTDFTLGERDFPARLVAPPCPVGRTTERAALRTAVTTGVPLVTIGGPPGIGRSSLAAEIRSLAEDAGARFVSGRSDPRRPGADGDGLREAFRALGRLLLTEPEAALAATRERLREALGENAPLIAALVPELGMVLGRASEPVPLDPAQAEDRLVQTAGALLRAVASPAYPLVLVLDDFHLAPQTAVRSIEAVAAADPVPGVTLVVTHRDPGPVLAGATGETLRLWLDGLTPAAVTQLITEVLRAPVVDPGGLAAAVHERTGGHPAETLALLNELRATGTLRIGAAGWTWDPDALRRHLGETDAGERLATRIRVLPEPARELLTATACLGGTATPELLGAACGQPAGAVLDALAPALDDGLAAFAGECVRIAHERVQDALRHGAVTARAGIARRLAAAPGYRQVAADLLLAAEPLTDAADRTLAGPLFAEAATALRVLDPARTERFISAALRVDDGTDRHGLLLLHAERHAALCRLGRQSEADEEYRYVETNCPDPIGRVPSACVQIGSLNGRARFADALDLGIDLLAGIGVPVTRAPEELRSLAEAGMRRLAEWAAALPADGDPRPENDDRAHRARAQLINALLPNALVAGPMMMAWLQTTAHRLWVADGPAAWLAGPVAASGFGLISARGDYHSGYRIVRHLLVEAERRGWERSAAELRFILISWAGHWHERLEDVLPVARTAFTGLTRLGATTQAGLTCSGLAAYLLDTGSVGALDEQVTAALRYAHRTGHTQAGLIQTAYRQFVRAMRGETHQPGGFTDDGFDEAAHLATVAGNAPAGHAAYALRGLAALITGDEEAARAATAEAAARIDRNPGFYLVTTTMLLCALTGVDLDRAAAWLAARAEDAPGNFSHLASLAEAELARRDGDRWAATVAYDRALREVSRRRRHWHHAVIAERAAAFQLAEGNEYAGNGLLRLARDGYAAWGATAKVRALEAAHHWLRGRPAEPGRAVSSTGGLANSDIDLLGVLDAARTLSSETRVHALHERVDEVLRALTGATDVLLVRPGTDAGPRSVIRYVQRTRAAVVSEDAVRDDRFARDEYFAGVAQCALLALPVVTRGEDRAVLILENRSSRNAFTADRLDAVRLVTGQLAVSLENAQLYASLEAKIADRTRELEEANIRLEQLAVTDPLTGLTNRRRMDALLTAEWRRAARPRHPLSIAMIDIDHFKGYNDHYGHQGGDRCLATVAATVAAQVRSTDHVARYGGEEFCIILPETPLSDALVVAERVRSAVEALHEPHAPSPRGIVTVSIGVAAALPRPDRDVDALVKTADECLYAAKRAGRNRVSTE